MEMSSLIWAMGGLLAGKVMVSLMSSWVRAIVEVLRGESLRRRWGMVLAVSLFNAGPWAIFAAAIFAYYEHSEPWAPWFFGGVAASILLFGIIAARVYAIQRSRQRGRNAA